MTDPHLLLNDTPQTLPNATFIDLMTAVLARGASFRFQARGFSMSPFIRDGDVLTLAPAPQRIRLGEVVSFINSCSSRLSVHRSVQTGRKGYLIRGDNSPEPDGFVSHAGILGRVIRVERRGRRVRLGLGPERLVIAYLSHRGWLVPLLSTLQNILHK